MLDITTKSISLAVTPNGPMMDVFICEPSAIDAPRTCILLPEIFGITEDIKQAATRIARMGYRVAIPDLHFRVAPRTVLEANAEGRQKGLDLLHAMTRENVLTDLAALHGFLTKKGHTDRDIAILGFSAGGHIAYLAAAELPFRAAIILYGGWVGNTGILLSQPEATVTLTPGIAKYTGKLLYIVGGDDHLIQQPEVDAIGKALEQAEADHRIVVYEGVGHGFMFEGRTSFNQAAHDDTWRQVEALLTES